MKKKLKWIVAILVILFILVNLIIFIFGNGSTVMVGYDTMEEAFEADLYLFKDEVVIDTPSGVLRPTAKDGERVHKGARIGAVLSADTDEGALHEYLRIQDRISRLSASSSGESYSDTVRTDEQISAISVQASAYAEKGDMAKISRLKDELLIAKDEKSAAAGRKEELISLLTQRRSALESGIGNSIREIYSPKAGTLLLYTDGMEEDMHTDKAKNLSPSTLQELTDRIGKGTAGCKLLYNSTWKGACTVDETTAAALAVGQTLQLRFHDADDAMEKATVSEISEPEDGKCVVVFSSNRTVDGLLGWRKASVDVVIRRHQGFKVPAKAVKEENGQTGVYVKTITDKVFKPSVVSFRDDDYAIIKECEETSLRLYDTVIY